MFWRLSDVRFHGLVTRIDSLEARILALKAQHEALRSRYYATRGGGTGPPGDVRPVVTPGSREEKDSILAAHGMRRRNGPA